MDAEPAYTVFIRLPFPRGSFVDPPPVNWDAAKDEALWSILSGVAKTEIDWNELATTFEVTVDFLLQQVTYLTERHASQVRAQMRRATASKGSSAPSPVPGSDPDPMRRTGSHSRAPSALSIRKDLPLAIGIGRADSTATSIPSTPKGAPTPAFGGARPQVSRASSSNTAVPTIATAGGSAAGSLRAKERYRVTSLPIVMTPTSAVAPEEEEPPAQPPSPGPAESTSSVASSSSSSPAQSRIIRRPPRFPGHSSRPDGDQSLVADEDDDEAEPAFLPYRSPPSRPAPGVSGDGNSGQFTDPGATLRGDPRPFSRRLVSGSHQQGSSSSSKGKERALIHHSQTSDSSTSSAAMILSQNSASARNPQRPPGPLSPRRTAELAGKAKGRGGTSRSGDGSDGTPSMGSSFSDLDDASVTQSALEEALASKMQDGGTIGIGSRMSTISNAFRSKYLPRTNAS